MKSRRRLIAAVMALALVLGLAGLSLASAQAAWPPLKVELSIQQEGNLFTAVVWVRNEGDFSTDVLNVRGHVPKGAKYVDSWAGGGPGVNKGVFDGNDVGWVNTTGVKAGGRQGPFVYSFDTSTLGADCQADVLAWVSWAGKLPGSALSGTVSIHTPTGPWVAPSTMRVVVPDPDNLQYLNFWIAQGAGFFKEEGLDVQVLTPPNPLATLQFLLDGRAEVALLPPPQYLTPIAQGQPILIFANLLQNDPINLVVRKEIAEARKLSPTAPLAERLKGIQGLRVGVAPGPPPRLRALFASVGMDIDRDIQVVILGQERQLAFTGSIYIDALYAHTPFLEKALVEQGAMLLVDQLRGEFPELTGLNIHSLVTTRALATANPKALAAMTRAIYRAQQLIHSDLKASANALVRSGVSGVDQMPVETTLRLYEPAVPKTPDVSIKAIERTNKYFGVPGTAPADLSRVNLADYVAPQFAQEAVGSQVTACVPAGATVRLDAAVGTPPSAGWIWAVAEIATGAEEVIDGPQAHGFFWIFHVVKGSSDLSTAEGKRTLSSGEAVFVPARQEHTHRYAPQSRILVFDLHAADDPPSAFHRGKALLASEAPIGVKAGLNYRLQVREFSLAPGEGTPEQVAAESSFVYVAEGTLTTRVGDIVTSTEAGKAVAVAPNVRHVESNEGSTPLRFILAEVR